MTNREYVTALYRFILNREPDPEGLAAQVAALDRGHDPRQLFESFLRSPERNSESRRSHQKNRRNLPLNSPSTVSEDERIEITARCRDSDPIPKVAEAGRTAEFQGERVQIMHNGLKVVADGYYGEWMTRLIGRLEGHHEPQEEIVFHQVLSHVPPTATMIELGGYWSYYSLWFLSQFPETRSAVVLEPDPENLAIGRKNAELNSLSPRFLQAAAGGLGEVRFRSQNGNEISVKSLDVPTIMTEAGLDRLDILHCDAQGVELDVLLGCEKLLAARAIRFLIVSTHATEICGDPLIHQRCLEFLEKMGGQILIEHDVHESFSGDGLIAAYFGSEPINWVPPQLSFNRYSHSLFENPLFRVDRSLAMEI